MAAVAEPHDLAVLRHGRDLERPGHGVRQDGERVIAGRDEGVGEPREDAPPVVTDHRDLAVHLRDRKSTRLNSSHVRISYAVFCLKKKTFTVLVHLAAPDSVALLPPAPRLQDRLRRTTELDVHRPSWRPSGHLTLRPPGSEACYSN